MCVGFKYIEFVAVRDFKNSDLKNNFWMDMTEEKFSLTNDRFRYFVLTLGCICLTSTSSNLFTFNIGQVCMAPSSNLTVSFRCVLK